MWSNVLRLTLPTGERHETLIRTGSQRGARMVRRPFAELALAHWDDPRTKLEVSTSRGWMPRRIIKSGRNFYTRELR